MRFFVLFLAVIAAGCAGQEPIDKSGMEVSATLRAVHRCSRISPEIEVSQYPADTAMFDVRLEEQGNHSAPHGGGTWLNDNTGIIPEGALMQYYRGACPPPGTTRTYQYVVTAMDANYTPLARARYVFEQD